MTPTTLTLASASPARAQTLRNAGIEPQIMVTDADEDALIASWDGADHAGLVAALAELKLSAALAAGVSTDLVLACDSMLLINGQMLGKPHTPQVAKRRWLEMNGGRAQLLTGHALAAPASGRKCVRTAVTDVFFATLTEAEIDAYIASGEPLQVAGAFTVDSLGGPFVSRIEGDYHAVVGVSLPLLRELVNELGYSWPTLWNRGR